MTAAYGSHAGLQASIFSTGFTYSWLSKSSGSLCLRVSRRPFRPRPHQEEGFRAWGMGDGNIGIGKEP